MQLKIQMNKKTTCTNNYVKIFLLHQLQQNTKINQSDIFACEINSVFSLLKCHTTKGVVSQDTIKEVASKESSKLRIRCTQFLQI